jgi:hypothetical protein
MALFVFAVAETVHVEETVGAASTPFSPIWVLVNVLVAKFTAHISFVSMQSLVWGCLFLMRYRESSHFLPSFLPHLSLPGSCSGRFPPFWEVVSSGAIILKVGGRSMWKDHKSTCETFEEKSMIESFSQVIICILSTKFGSAC